MSKLVLRCVDCHIIIRSLEDLYNHLSVGEQNQLNGQITTLLMDMCVNCYIAKKIIRQNIERYVKYKMLREVQVLYNLKWENPIKIKSMIDEYKEWHNNHEAMLNEIKNKHIS